MTTVFPPSHRNVLAPPAELPAPSVERPGVSRLRAFLLARSSPIAVLSTVRPLDEVVYIPAGAMMSSASLTAPVLDLDG